jgi:predicted DNA-binding protein (MmcQ/YjbR family)
MPEEMKKTIAKVREFALGLPEAREDFPWGERVVKVGKKVFLFLGKEGLGVGLSVKLPQSMHEALSLSFAEPTGYGLGKSGWISASFASGATAPFELLCDWVRESYGAVASRKLVDRIGAPSPQVAKTAPKKAAPKKAAAKKSVKKVAAKTPAKKSAKKNVKAKSKR